MADREADRALALARLVLVEWDDAWEYRGPLDDLDPAPMRRTLVGWLTHMSDEVIAVVHDRDDMDSDVYASRIPRQNVTRLVYLKEEQEWTTASSQ